MRNLLANLELLPYKLLGVFSDVEYDDEPLPSKAEPWFDDFITGHNGRFTMAILALAAFFCIYSQKRSGANENTISPLTLIGYGLILVLIWMFGYKIVLWRNSL